jgi:hypothetical protein
MESLSSSSIMSGNHSSTSSVERSETIASEDRLSQLPEETIQHIFGYLNQRELGSNSLVSRRWDRLSSDPTLLNALDLTKTSSLSIIDASNWKKGFGDLSQHGVSVEDEPPIDNSTCIPLLKQFSSLPLENKEGESREKGAGITLLTIPKGLTCNKLVKMAEEVKFNSIWKGGVLKEIGDIEVDKTYRILITNNILEGSRRCDFEYQKDLVEKTFKCEMPSALAALALIVTTFIDSGKRLYIKGTLTRCTDRVWELPVVVGGFSFNDVNVHADFDDAAGGSYFYGVAALRKL